MSTSAAARRITIDVVSDTICPWCYIGKRRLEKAIKSFARTSSGLSFDVVWHPFQLDPTLPTPGVSKLERYKSKFGAERMAQMLPYMNSVGRAEGITFSYEGKIGNTIDSHIILELAYATGGAALQDRVCEALMQHYFEKEGDISDRAAIASVAVSAGLAPALVEAQLADPARRAEVLREAETWRRRYNITGVPFFVIDGKYKLSGAQEPAAFEEAFEQLMPR